MRYGILLVFLVTHLSILKISPIEIGKTVMDFIRLQDTLASEGKVISASSTMTYENRPLACKGDLVLCHRHPDVQPNDIIEGDETMTNDGVPLARHNHRARCGCRLISSLS